MTGELLLELGGFNTYKAVLFTHFFGREIVKIENLAS